MSPITSPCSLSQGLSQRVQEALAGATRVAMETFQAMDTVRGFAFEAGAVKRYQQQLQRVYGLEATGALTYAATGWTSGVRTWGYGATHGDVMVWGHQDTGHGAGALGT